MVRARVRVGLRACLRVRGEGEWGVGSIPVRPARVVLGGGGKRGREGGREGGGREGEEEGRKASIHGRVCGRRECEGEG